MSDRDVYAKTAKGQQELQSRALKLPPRLRSLLIMVDGNITAGELQRAAMSLGAPQDWLETLAMHDLIALSTPAAAVSPPSAAGVAPPTLDVPLDIPSADPTQTERFRAVQKFMNDTVVEALGLRAFFFTLKLERCYNLADLGDLVPEYLKALAKGKNDVAVRALESRVRDMLR